jgi:hypothetical protein
MATTRKPMPDLETYEKLCSPLFKELRAGQENLANKVGEILENFASLRTKLENGVRKTLTDLEETDRRIEARVEAQIVSLRRAFWWAMAVFGIAGAGWVLSLVLQLARVAKGGAPP